MKSRYKLFFLLLLLISSSPSQALQQLDYIVAVINEGVITNQELQKSKQTYFKDRVLFYSTFPIQEQAKKGDWNYQLNSVYAIAILDFTFDDKDKDKTVVNRVKLMDVDKKEVFYDKLQFVFLQVPNFNKTLEQLETNFDKWLYIFKNLQALHKF